MNSVFTPLNEPTFHCGLQDSTVVKLLFEVTSAASQWHLPKSSPERAAPRICEYPNIHYFVLEL